MRSLEYIIRFPTRLLVKLCFGHFGIFLKFYSLLRFLHPKNHPKNNHRSLKRCSIRQIYFHCFKYMLRFLTKLLCKFFYHISEYHWRNVQFLRCFLPKKAKKYCRSLKWVWHPLNLLAPLVKLCFGNFRIFLKFCSHFQIFATQNPPKNHYRCLNEMQRLPKLLVLLKIHV